MSVNLIYISDEELPGLAKGKEYECKYVSQYKTMVTVKEYFPYLYKT